MLLTNILSHLVFNESRERTADERRREQSTGVESRGSREYRGRKKTGKDRGKESRAQ